MKHRTPLLFFCCLLFQMFSMAQQNRFIYIQTENRQPFYVNLNNAIYSSSASGYLIIPKLQEGTYQLNIGFPKNEWPRQVITYSIGKKDEGVLLKNFGDQRWGFYNLQNSQTTMAAGSKVLAANIETEDDDNFTQVLSQVVNTPDLKIKEKIPEPVPVPEVKTAELPITNVAGIVKRIFENVNDQGRELIYVADGDTISILIPAIVVAPPVELTSKKIDTFPSAAKVVEEKAVTTDPVITDQKPVADLPKAETEIKASTVTPEPKEVTKTSSVSMINSDCKGNADDEDFMKLRKKMASEENEVKMVVVAKKAFKSKCYTSSQIKNLSVLFLNDSGRFQFLESAYPFVSDSNNFSGLQSQLTDPYYITRFEALIRR